MGIEVVTLAGLAQGAVLELFQVELRRALDDIADVNRKADSAREVTFKVKIVPDAKRETADVQISAQTKLGVLTTVETRFYLGRHNGENVAVENNPKQADLFDAPGAAQRGPNVADFEAPNKQGAKA